MENLTKFWVEKKFAELNKKCFDGKLPTPFIIINHSKSFFGQCGMKNLKRSDYEIVDRSAKKVVFKKNPLYYIKISNFHNRSEKEVEQTLLHEMIHLCLDTQGYIFEHHGRRFKAMAREMDKYGYDIHRCSSFDNIKDNGEKVAPIKLIKFEDKGVIWLCAVNDLYFNVMLSRAKKAWKNVETYTTTNKVFADYRLCRKNFSGHTFKTQKEFEEKALKYIA